MYYVNIYEVYKAYGGPEEGGWWFNAGECVEYHTADTQHEAAVMLNQIKMDLEKRKAARKMGYGSHDGVDGAGQPDDEYLMIGGCWGEGEYRARIEEEEGTYFPKEIPRYE